MGTLMVVQLLFGAYIGKSALPTALAQQEPADSVPASANQAGAVTAENVQVRRVKVNFFINSIQQIDDETGSYAIDFWLDLFWRDPALDGKTVDQVDTATLWNPQIQALNSNDLTVLYQSYSDSFEPDTNVYLSQRLVGVFTTPFNLSRFPFDSQQLEVQLESQEYDSNRLLFDFLGADQAIIYSEKPFTFPLPTGKYISPEFSLGGWSLTAANVVEQIHVLPYDKSSWAQFRIEIQLERQARAYVLKVMLVFGLLMVLGATVFVIGIEELRYRLLALFMLLLAAVTFDFTRLQNSPRVAYLTLLDLQALLCYLLLGLAIGLVVVTAILKRRGWPDLAQRLNWLAVVGYGILIILINLGLGWYGAGG
ncbi:MAG: hypothetical protein R3C14_42810 [Caldilineaceae bacterium]